MATEWYYSVDGNKQGPVSSRQLADLARSGTLKPTDNVRKDGKYSVWVPAVKVKGLEFSQSVPSANPSAILGQPWTPSPPLPKPAPLVMEWQSWMPPPPLTQAPAPFELVEDEAIKSQERAEPATSGSIQDRAVGFLRSADRMITKTIGFCVLALLAVGVVVVALQGVGILPASGASEVEAKLKAKEFVKKRLRAPSTADFPSQFEIGAREFEPDKWRVSGYVDAQNGFGAQIRSDWTVTMTYNRETKKWTLESCTIGGSNLFDD